MGRSTLIFASLILAASSWPTPVAADETPVDVLIERHSEALGGREAIGRIRSIISSGEIEMLSTGMKGTIKSKILLPCLSYKEARLGLFAFRQGFDGQRSWMVGPNGMLQIMRDEGSLKNQSTTCLLESFGYLSEMYDSIETSGTSVVDSSDCHVLTLFPRNGFPCRLHIDSSTWLISMLEIESMTGTIEQKFHDYREKGGVMFPFRTVTTQKAAGQSLEVRTHSLEINKEIDPTVFVPPGDIADDFAFSDEGDSVSIDFIYVNRHIYLPVRTGGGPGRPFLLDSGAGMTMIDEKFSRELGLEIGGTIPGAGAGGMTDFHMTRLPGFEVGGIRFDEQTVIVYPISSLTGRYSGIESGGVLGYDFLSRFVTKIDYAGRKITFFRRGLQTPAVGADTLDAPLFHKIFSAAAVLDGDHGGTFLLDTGASASILQKGFVDSGNLLNGRKSVEIVVAGAGGEDRAAVARFDSFRIGETVLLEPVFTIPLGGRGIGAFEGISGVVGNDILERFTVWLDYDGQTAVLKQGSSFGAPFWPDRSGMQISVGDNGYLVTILVIPGTPAAKAGILSGDELNKVGGIRADGESIGRIIGLLEGAGGDKLEVEYRRKGEKRRATIDLEPYI